MTCVDYWNTNWDPFDQQKQNGLLSSLEPIQRVAGNMNVVCGNEYEREAFEGVVLTALWGNKMDLSLWPSSKNGSGGGGGDGKEEEGELHKAMETMIREGRKFILADDLMGIVEHAEKVKNRENDNNGRDGKRRLKRFDIIVDNAGFELFTDLCLADYVISTKMVNVVVVHLKGHPVFVSDAMVKDVNYTVSVLCESSETAVQELGSRWRKYIDEGRMVLSYDYYWSQPFAFWEMPTRLRETMSGSNLVFIKGDCNYRRCLGDREWQLDTPWKDIMNYFPAPAAALRVLKAELGCGMSKDKMAEAESADKDWLTNGKFAVVQFLDPSRETSNET